ncbi:MAG TPA: UDP-3-O-(3-hydroxymyristoyl)glucosamine N-acyltransferase [Candidatus Acidoferrales bacterium]|nr:UDP-3-O-(3-hydroxymyristoyl)glucosamine N-acyltransferase [Candidatus Acidoferrales bacterium]
MAKLTCEELARFLSARMQGDGAKVVTGIAAPEDAGTDDLIYVEAVKHKERAEKSAARCAIIGEGMELKGKTTLSVAQPKLAFAKAAEKLIAPPRIAEGRHATALIDASAKLGDGVTVGPYAVIEAEVTIGANSEIGAFCFIGRGAKVGEKCCLFPRVTLYAGAKLRNRVIAHSGAVIGGDGFGYVVDEGRYMKFPQVGTVEIGDDVEIGSNATIARGSLGKTRIDRGVKLDNMVHVAHNVHVGEDTVVAAQTGISGSCEIGDHVIIGGQVGIADRCTIESGSIVGAQAGIPTGKKIRAGETVWGTPARPLARFKKQYAWFERLPELAERLREIEEKGS